MPIEKEDMLGAALLAAAATLSGLLLRGIGWMIGRSLQSIINENNTVVLGRFQELLRESVAPMEDRAAMRYHDNQVHFQSIDEHLRLQDSHFNSIDKHLQLQDQRVDNLGKELSALTTSLAEITRRLNDGRRR